MQSLSRMAEILGQPVESDVWRKRGAAMARRMIKDMWDEDAGLFWALRDEEPIRVVTPFNLFPLWTGELPKPINDRLIRHLLSPSEFAGPYPIPTVARNDPHFNPEMMWRGPVWGNVNYFFVEALAKVGREDLADELSERTLEMIAGQPDIYEYYNPETGQAPSTAADIFGWTAAVYIDLAIRQSQRRYTGEVTSTIESADQSSAET
jgi:glycogen debranching enzyme